MEAPTASPPSANGVTTVEQWAARAIHTITLHSGARVKIRLPDLSQLLRRDLLPEKLRLVALKQVFAGIDGVPAADETSQAVNPEDRLEMAKDLAELLDWIVADMVVDPRLTVADLAAIPSEDKELLAALAQRERDTDALGVRLGVAKLSTWENFRLRHGCPEGCEGCEAVRRDFSTVHMGEL